MVTSSSGSSSRASSEAEYTDAPASLTITSFTVEGIAPLAIALRTNASVSRPAVPLPIAIAAGGCAFTAAASFAVGVRLLAGVRVDRASPRAPRPWRRAPRPCSRCAGRGRSRSPARAPSGGASSRLSRFCAKTRIASSSAFSFSFRRSSDSSEGSSSRSTDSPTAASSSRASTGAAPRLTTFARTCAAASSGATSTRTRSTPSASPRSAASTRCDGDAEAFSRRPRWSRYFASSGASDLPRATSTVSSPALLEQRAHLGADLGLLRDRLGDDVARALEHRLEVRQLLRRVDVRLPERLARERRGRLREDRLRERPQPPLARDLRPGPPLRLVGEVEILELGQRRRLPHRLLERRGEHLLLGERGEDARPAALPGVDLHRVVGDLLDRPVVEPAGDLLPVARDERDRRAPLEQLEGAGDARQRERELAGDEGGAVGGSRSRGSGHGTRNLTAAPSPVSHSTPTGAQGRNCPGCRPVNGAIDCCKTFGVPIPVSSRTFARRAEGAPGPSV